MIINKKIVWHVIIVVILVSSGVVYAATAKNNWGAKKYETKKISENRNWDESKNNQPSSQPVTLDTPAQEAPAITDTSADTQVSKSTPIVADASEYPSHKNVSTTYFWVGEGAGKDNGNISNISSAWDEDWAKHFGGVDDPKKRNGFYPSGFTPKENPFYFALPYNDFNENGKQKNDAEALAIWANGKKLGSAESMCKNQWIKITKNGKSAYAQWEDVGPFGEDDKAYVFGNSVPRSKENNHAGLDVSPAVRDYLSLSDIDKTDWQFIDAQDVPSGPWKKIVTTSKIYWK